MSNWKPVEPEVRFQVTQLGRSLPPSKGPTRTASICASRPEEQEDRRALGISARGNEFKNRLPEWFRFSVRMPQARHQFSGLLRNRFQHHTSSLHAVLSTRAVLELASQRRGKPYSALQIPTVSPSVTSTAALNAFNRCLCSLSHAPLQGFSTALCVSEREPRGCCCRNLDTIV